MLGFLIDLSREQLLELVRIILEEVPWDLNTRRAIRNLLHHFHKRQVKCSCLWLPNHTLGLLLYLKASIINFPL